MVGASKKVDAATTREANRHYIHALSSSIASGAGFIGSQSAKDDFDDIRSSEDLRNCAATQLQDQAPWHPSQRMFTSLH
jgi:type 1 glutamine amidotransferase